MATFVFSLEVMNVTAPFLDNPVLLPLVAVHGAASEKNFFHCVSKNTKLHRLLVDGKLAPAFGTLKAALRKSDILKRLKEVKDAEWTKHVLASCPTMKTIRYTVPENRAKILSLPATVEIVAPQVLTVESRPLTVALNKTSKGLVMELTSEGIEYLRAVVTAQLLDGGCAGKPHARTKIPHGDRVNTSVPNLSWSYTKQRYRSAFHPQDADRKKRRRQNFYTESMDRAMAFVETGDRGVDTEPPKDVEDRA